MSLEITEIYLFILNRQLHFILLAITSYGSLSYVCLWVGFKKKESLV